MSTKYAIVGGKLIDGIDDAVCAMFLKLTGFGVPPTATQALSLIHI